MIKPLVGVSAALLLAGCTAGQPARVVTVTVPPPAHSTTPAAHVSDTPATSGAAAPSTAVGPPVTKLSGTCDDISDFDVSQALGGVNVAGKDAFVVGQPEKDIGRLAYLNCRYGVTGSGAAATPKIEIGVSLYGTPAEAANRISATVDDYSSHGASTSATRVAGQSASLLTGGSGAGYSVPLLVVADGQRTVAVSIAASLASGAKIATDAAALAELALKNIGP